MKKAIAITAGEPAGIGYDILVLAAQKNNTGIPWLVFADPDVLKKRAQLLNVPLQIELFKDFEEIASVEKTLTVYPTPCLKPVEAGSLNVSNTQAVLEGLQLATESCLQQKTAALLTLPIHKGIINEAGIPFSGHTEFLAEACKLKKVVMMLASRTCRVALVTTHIPLTEVHKKITEENITETIMILSEHLKNFYHIPYPTIFVTGLNPHAGENGYLGREEIDIIEPCLKKLRQKNFAELIGPVAADTLFQPIFLQKADAIVAMYHDQGLAPLKALYFGDIVNITCGLPFIRVSVDHGVALDKAGTDTVNIKSFLTAIDVLENNLIKK